MLLALKPKRKKYRLSGLGAIAKDSMGRDIWQCWTSAGPKMGTYEQSLTWNGPCNPMMIPDPPAPPPPVRQDRPLLPPPVNVVQAVTTTQASNQDTGIGNREEFDPTSFLDALARFSSATAPAPVGGTSVSVSGGGAPAESPSDFLDKNKWYIGGGAAILLAILYFQNRKSKR